MPLFGPNIKKMKEKRDFEGLIKELRNKNPKVRIEVVKALSGLEHAESLIEALKDVDLEVHVEAAEAIKDSGDPKAINALINTLTDTLKFGEREEQVEAITLIQGRAPEDFLAFALPGEPKRKQVLKKVRKKLNIENFRDALLGVVKQRKSGGNIWYALVALVELGDRSSEVLGELIEFSHAWINTLDTMMEGTSAIFTWALGRSVQKETLRALSYFRGNSVAADAIIKAYEGELLSSPRIEVEKENAIYALGALGDPTTRERLEYWTVHGDEEVKKQAKIALECFGRATFDEIKTEAKTKFGID